MSRRRAELLDSAVWKRQSVSGEFIETMRDKGNARIPADLPATNLFIPSTSNKRSSLSKDAKAAWEKQQTIGRPTTADNAINVSISPHIQKDSGSTPLLPFVSPFSVQQVSPDTILDEIDKAEMQLTYSQARLKAAGWSKDGNTNAISRTFPLRSPDRRSSQGLELKETEGLKDERHVERMRTNQMTGDQKAADVIQASSRKAEFIKMQREMVEEKLMRLRKAHGYQDNEPVEKPLPSIKAALDALAGLTSEADDDDALAELIAEEDKSPQRKKSLSFLPQTKDRSGLAFPVSEDGTVERPGNRLKSKLMFRESLKKKNMEFASTHIAGMSFSALHGFRSNAASPVGGRASASRKRWKRMEQVIQ
jgi:hypothetical protein